MKIIFDASIHLGQFCINDEAIRVACKNSQTSIKTTQNAGPAASYTFNENGWMDKIIWGIDRESQNTFYPFMDVFYSVTDTTGVDLTIADTQLAIEIVDTFPDLSISNALTCAVAINNQIEEVHTVYPGLLSQNLKEYMATNHNVSIVKPESGKEEVFQDSSQLNLESLYQAALEVFRKNQVNLVDYLHD
ncbi:MAG: hypothetical protein ACI83D_000062 [Planctomycetota bacterium]|jgi:hypothetical protein